MSAKTSRAPDKARLLEYMGLDASGVRKGSRFVPLVVTLLALTGFYIFQTTDGHKQLDKVFSSACVAASGSKTESKWTQAGRSLRDSCVLATDNPSTTGLNEAKVEVASVSEVFALKTSNDKSLELAAFTSEEIEASGTQFLQLVHMAVSAYGRDLYSDFRKITRSTVETTAWLALYALLPGIAGLIYRRNFLFYFLVPFLGLLGLYAADRLPLPEVPSMPESGKILAFVSIQAVIVLIAYRVRRHANVARVFGAGVIPVSWFNRLLFWLLVGIGVLCWLDQPAWLKVPGDIDSRVSVWPHWLVGSLIYKLEFLFLGLPLLYTLLRRSDMANPDVNKNIVVCLDGTSNTPDQEERGYSAQTNVFKLFTMLKPDGDAGGIVPHGTFDASITKRYGDKQIAFYYTGVGNKFETGVVGQFVGGATGLGASDIVQRAYLDVMRVYVPGDRIFLFGFSRGAAIARLLANAIDHRGAPRVMWTLKLFGRHWTIWTSKHKRKEAAHVPIAVLGCWDTVGAFGIAKKVAGIDFQKIDLFKDMSVPDNVAQAYHMLALDEDRYEFRPTLMEPDPIKPERIVEVWFAGDHANAGGGWATPKLSDVTLGFLLQRISSGYAYGQAVKREDGTEETITVGPVGNEAWGLYLAAYDSRTITTAKTPHGYPVGIDPDPLGQLRHWQSSLYSYEPRSLPLHAVISETVFERMTQSKPVYAPQALFNLNEALEKKRTTVTNEIDRLTSTNSLTAEESVAIREFKDKLRLMRWPQYVAELEDERRVAGLPLAPRPSEILDNSAMNAAAARPAVPSGRAEEPAGQPSVAGAAPIT